MNSTSSIITIGREYGSGGRQIGQEVAKYFGIKCYDKELLQVAAKESGLCEELFASQDEKPLPMTAESAKSCLNTMMKNQPIVFCILL